jgi:phospholipase C
MPGRMAALIAVACDNLDRHRGFSLASNGYLSHNYADHVSLLKFVERNWDLEPITKRSRDNLPNPVANRETPWVPRNAPALDDLFDLFDFNGQRTADWGSDSSDDG